MLKKSISILLAAMMLLSITACGKDSVGDTTTTTEYTTTIEDIANKTIDENISDDSVAEDVSSNAEGTEELSTEEKIERVQYYYDFALEQVTKENVEDATILLDVSYNGEEVGIPFDYSLLTEDGWYVFKENTSHVRLQNSSYGDILEAADLSGEGILSSEQLSANGVYQFEYEWSGTRDPAPIAISGIGIGSTAEDILDTFGGPYGVTGILMDSSLGQVFYYLRRIPRLIL